MKLSNEQILSEAIQYYEDFDGEIEESLFNCLVERIKKAECYEVALTEIAKDNGTPYTYIAEKVLKD